MRAFTIDGYNTYHDWGLVLTAKSIPPAEPKLVYIPLDGKNGSLDLTEALAGETTYQDIPLSASFSLSGGDYVTRERRLCGIILLLQGRKVRIVEPDDPDHYLLGRVRVKRGVHHAAYHTFTIEATCEPWRYALEPTRRTVPVDGEVDVVLNNTGARTVRPDLEVDGDVVVEFNGLTATLTSGRHQLADIRLKSGANVVHLSGEGTVTFIYTEAVR